MTHESYRLQGRINRYPPLRFVRRSCTRHWQLECVLTVHLESRALSQPAMVLSGLKLGQRESPSRSSALAAVSLVIPFGQRLGGVQSNFGGEPDFCAMPERHWPPLAFVLLAIVGAAVCEPCAPVIWNSRSSTQRVRRSRCARIQRRRASRKAFCSQPAICGSRA